MTEPRTLDRPDNSWITAFAARSVALKELLQGAVRDAKSKACAKAIASRSEPAALGARDRWFCFYFVYYTRTSVTTTAVPMDLF